MPSESPSRAPVSTAPRDHGRANRRVDVPALVCPTCRGTLSATGTSLGCDGGHTWPVKDGIPRFAPTQNYASAFGAQWLAFRRTQLDSFTGVPISRDRAHRCLGPDVMQRLQRGEEVRILEVGCGAGRFTEVLLAAGAIVTSVDLSSAVEANQQNFPQSDVHRIVQADVMQLPFAPGQFDVAFCLGVVQHTPNSEATIAKLYEQVRPGGHLVIDHYPTLGIGGHLSIQPLFRAVMKRLPSPVALRWTDRLVRLFLPLHSRFRKNRVAQTLVSRVSPVLTYYNDLPLTEEQHRQWALLDTHDALTDWYKHRRNVPQLRRAAEQLGATDIWCAPGGNGVELRARRPRAS